MKKLTLIMLSVVLSISSCSTSDDSDNVAVPTLTTITPNNGPKTTVVTISGTNFGTDPSVIQVFFNEKEAVVQSITDTEIITKVPARAYTGMVKVMVDGVELIGPEFTYIITEVLVDTFTGSTGGFADGTLENAKFRTPHDVVLDSQGNLFVADNANSKIRKISPSGIVSTFAGSTPGFADGNGQEAKFSNPVYIEIDKQDNLYVADIGNYKIRKITPNGEVTTFAGSTQGNINGIGAQAQFSRPMGIAIDSENNLYVSDDGNHNIRKITPSRAVTTLAGSTLGFQDGTGASAKFYSPQGLAIDKENNLLVADTGNHRIRKISQAGVVSTLAGSSIPGLEDGTLAIAKFRNPFDIAIDRNANIYIADYSSHAIRKINSNGVVSTIAGNGTSGVENGIGTDARFDSPTGLCIGPDQTLYIADSGNHRIRKITQE